ncbi:MAG: ABC transporter permease [Fibrobacteres bacterium]|nr:ABC transporter permease [Fibrobacterota bacterium]
MRRFIIRRLMLALPVLLLVVLLTFLLVHSAPGSPFASEKNLSPETLAALQAEYGLDKPLPTQLYMYVNNLAHGYLGRSIHFSDWSVNEIIANALPVSMRLGAFALLFAILAGVPLGAVAALRRNTLIDHSAMAVAVAGISIPSFVIASLLILLFSFTLKWLPSAGWGNIENMILPALTLSAPFIAYISRITRGTLIEVLSEDYIRTARAKGVSEKSVLFHHALRNGLTPLISFLGPASAGILTGSVVVEKVFAVPGLGIHFVHSALHRDYFLAVGCALIYGFILLMFNLLSDILYVIADPRISHDSKQ